MVTPPFTPCPPGHDHNPPSHYAGDGDTRDAAAKLEKKKHQQAIQRERQAYKG